MSGTKSNKALSVVHSRFRSDTPPRECRHFATISAHRHRTPSPPARSRIIAQQQLAVWVAALLQPTLLSFGDQLGARPGNRGQKPLKPFVLGHKSELPSRAVSFKLVMAFCHAKNYVDRLYPFPVHASASYLGAKR